MSDDISQSVSQRGDGAQDAENCRIAAIADELERLCAIHEAQCGAGRTNVTPFDIEQQAAERMAKEQGFWIPMLDVFSLGVPGPSGNENDTYVAEKVIYKINNLFNSGSIVRFLRKILMHNIIFPDTAYSFHGFAGFDGRSVQPVIIQPRVANAQPANQIIIDTSNQIYVKDKTNTTEVCLQDTISATTANTTALGGLSLMKLTQTEYDNLLTKDNNTVYIIVN